MEKGACCQIEIFESQGGEIPVHIPTVIENADLHIRGAVDILKNLIPFPQLVLGGFCFGLHRETIEMAQRGRDLTAGYRSHPLVRSNPDRFLIVGNVLVVPGADGKFHAFAGC